MTITEDERKSLEAIKKHLKAFCKGKKNITLIRFNFNQTQQMENQTFDAYLTELRHKVRHCEYAQLEDSLFQGSNVNLTLDVKWQKRLR